MITRLLFYNNVLEAPFRQGQLDIPVANKQDLLDLIGADNWTYLFVSQGIKLELIKLYGSGLVVRAQDESEEFNFEAGASVYYEDTVSSLRDYMQQRLEEQDNTGPLQISTLTNLDIYESYENGAIVLDSPPIKYVRPDFSSIEVVQQGTGYLFKDDINSTFCCKYRRPGIEPGNVSNDYFPDAWLSFTYSVDGLTVTLTDNDGLYSELYINWGDGSMVTLMEVAGVVEHTYQEAGEYAVSAVTYYDGMYLNVYTTSIEVG